MAKTNHLDKKKAKAKQEAREVALAERAARGPIKQPWTTKRIALLLIIIALSLFMLIPLLAGVFQPDGLPTDGGSHSGLVSLAGLI